MAFNAGCNRLFPQAEVRIESEWLWWDDTAGDVTHVGMPCEGDYAVATVVVGNDSVVPLELEYDVRSEDLTVSIDQCPSLLEPGDEAVITGRTDVRSSAHAVWLVAAGEGDNSPWWDAMLHLDSAAAADRDDDGWDMIFGCDPPAELGQSDCDDLDANVYPGALEVVGDGIDSDCDGVAD
jgi:hypothetical protein